MRQLPSREELLECLDYDPDTGILTWKSPTSRRVCVGDEAGSANDRGYIQVRFKGVIYKAHRLIWKMATGVDPPSTLDHMNKDRSDNRIANLREATVSQNACNQKLLARNTSGHKGMSWNKRNQKWEVYVQLDKRRQRLGLFADKNAALEILRNQRENLHGKYHSH